MKDLFWSIESFALRENVLFGFGWVFHVCHDIQLVRVRMRFEGTEGFSIRLLTTDFGKPRVDVARDFPDQPRAANSGFAVFCAFPDRGRLAAISLEVQLSSGTLREVPIPLSRVSHFDHQHEASAIRQLLGQLTMFFKRGVQLVRAGQFVSLFDKVGRYLRGRPRTMLKHPNEIVHKLQVSERENLSLIIDHDLGGGANLYRDRMVALKIKAGASVVIFSYHVATLSYMLIVRSSRVNLRVSLADKRVLFDLLSHVLVREILYNTAVSFIRPEEIPQLLIDLKRITNAPLKVFVHDFFMVCPSHFLLDHTGKYCEIPDTKVCESCLPRNQQGFVSLFAEHDIQKWRAIWGAMLVVTDAIITFSNSTARILKQAYPQVQDSQISVIPHAVEYLSGITPTIKNTAQLCIGIVGQIGFHKGAAFVQMLAQEIKQRAVDIQIVVIGAIEAACEPSVVRQTGPYQHDELPRIIETSGANIMLFPSVWPETFSYVVQELMEMQLPVAAFNLGAPAERLHHYARGKVLVSTNASDVLDELIEFYRRVYVNV